MMSEFDPSARTPDMSVNVSLGEFHRTHDEALEARGKLGGGLDQLSAEELAAILTKLRAGQRLTNAETGIDFMYAQSYLDEIGIVLAELKRRS